MTFGGDPQGGMINGLAGVRAHFGEGPMVDSYIKMLKATRAIVTVAEIYFLSEPESAVENEAGEKFGQMLAALAEFPEKRGNITESLVALVVHMKNGGTFEEWFEGVDE